MGRIVVIHPDLGIGGAERLIVDASKALQERKHQVIIYTGYHNKERCFEETRDGTLNVIPIVSWFPRSIFGRFHAGFAYFKMILIALYVVIFSQEYDVVLCDQISACIPILKIRNFLTHNKSKIIFYCHFPDQLLTSRDSLLKTLYRIPIDLYEEWSTSLADIILVNSQFTKVVVRKTFKSLSNRVLQVLYPCVDVDKLRREQESNLASNDGVFNSSSKLIAKCHELSKSNFLFISLNRFERKKNLSLCIEALSEFRAAIEQDDERGQTMKAHLIVAGGYDERLIDCVQYYEELEELVNELKLGPYVTFVKSPSDKEKVLLLQMSHAILYTPENEHFGIVPIEAMALSKPVISCRSGGPLETVEHDVTGYLCDGDKYSFAEAMLKLNYNKDISSKFGHAGYERVRANFSYEAFGDRLIEICYPTTSTS